MLKGRPVAVGYAAARGVVAAASYEARRYGVRSAMPSVTAMRKCSELVFVPPRFEVYRAVSRQILTIFADYTPLIEPLSLDEAYLDVTDNLRAFRRLRRRRQKSGPAFFEKTGLTASAGISYNKFLAKLASDHRKPNGQFAVTPAMGAAFVELACRQISRRRAGDSGQDERLGILTGADLRKQSLAFLQQHFGKSGPWYHAIANGEDDRPVVPNRPRKSSGSETTFAKISPTRRHRGWRARDGGPGLGLVREDQRVWPHRDREDQICRFQAGDTQPLSVGSNHISVALRQVSLDLVRTVFPPAQGVRLVGVAVSNFGDNQVSPAEQLDLALTA